MADEKVSFRPKKDVGENLAITFPVTAGEEAGTHKTIKTWPYETKVGHEIDFLRNHPQVTDQPEPTTSSSPTKGGKS